MTDILDSRELSTPLREMSFLCDNNLEDITPLSHSGLYATVWTASLDTRPVIIKKYEAPYDLKESLIDYHNYIRNIQSHSLETGISPSTNLDIKSIDSDVYFVDQSAGTRDIDTILSDTTEPISSRYRLAANLLESIASIPRDSNNQLAFMIDGKISNFCPGDNGEFIYIDVYPAFTRHGDSHLMKPLPEHHEGKRNLQFDSFVLGDMYGVVGKYIGMLARSHPEVYSHFTSAWPADATSHKNIPDDIHSYVSHLLEEDSAFVKMLYDYKNSDTATVNRLLGLMR